jgi:hypothetical protein
MGPTDDTPQERDDKASVLARELRQFRWETRVAYIALLVVILLKA